MTTGSLYPKRLIEVDLPIRRISDHARREKSIRHGHISTLHIWWARRPLAACRAVLCAALWPDPADERCPRAFQIIAAERMWRWAREERARISAGSTATFDLVRQHSSASALTQHPTTLRQALLDFIADFANWDSSTVPAFLDTARSLTGAAHYGLSGDAANGGLVEPMDEREWRENLGALAARLATATRPLVVDPFAGGGSIPLEALRIGADAFASDLNPVAVLLNKVILEYLPRHGRRLAEAVREWGAWVKAEAEKELDCFYPRSDDGSTPIAYIWARTIRCEGPACGAEVPLLRSLWLVKKSKRSVALRIVKNSAGKRIDFEIVHKAVPAEVGKGTCGGGAGTCPICGYTTPVEAVRIQMSSRGGGAQDARLIAVVTQKPGEVGQYFRLPTKSDIQANDAAAQELKRRIDENNGCMSLVPDGEINHLRGFFNIVLYGITTWGKLFSPRQALALSTLSRLVRELPETAGKPLEPELLVALKTCLALVVNRVAVRCTSNCIWDATTCCIMQVFNQGQALPARWEFAEMTPLTDSGSGWSTCLEYVGKVYDHVGGFGFPGHAERASATEHPLPDDSAHAIVTDPPYYAAIPYADLSDFFFSWLKRSLGDVHSDLLRPNLVEKKEELVSLAHRAAMYREKDNAWFEKKMEIACAEVRRICVSSGVGVIVFANKETEAWEAMLAAIINAGWVVTASWPIDTESGNRLRAKNSAALASSVHLVVRPRKTIDGTMRMDEVGDWRDVLAELPRRIHEWMPRLAEEGVVGADAIFACLGPALEIFSRYARVEDSGGKAISLREYLEKVWAAVALEALSLVFVGANVEGFEPDARLTAMWLWTINAPQSANDVETGKDDTNEGEEDTEDAGGKKAPKGFGLEFDAARMLAQGLGANLEALTHLVEVKGDLARLLSVAERTRHLFGKEQGFSPIARSRRSQSAQGDFFAELSNLPTGSPEAETAWGEKTVTRAGDTTLDRVHQAMILFAASRGEALRRFLVEDAAGRDAKFWRLAQALSALYPKACEEKRWVDGVLARKKGLGL